MKNESTDDRINNAFERINTIESNILMIIDTLNFQQAAIKEILEKIHEDKKKSYCKEVMMYTEKSESIKNIAIALAKVQGAIKPAEKKSENKFYNSKYADLNSHPQSYSNKKDKGPSEKQIKRLVAISLNSKAWDISKVNALTMELWGLKSGIRKNEDSELSRAQYDQLCEWIEKEASIDEIRAECCK